MVLKKFVQILIKKGNRNKALKFLFLFFKFFKLFFDINAMFILRQALLNIMPLIKIRNYMLKKQKIEKPFLSSNKESVNKALNWLLLNAKYHSKNNYIFKLIKECLLAFKNKGFAIKARNNFYKVIIDNQSKIYIGRKRKWRKIKW